MCVYVIEKVHRTVRGGGRGTSWPGLGFINCKGPSSSQRLPQGWEQSEGLTWDRSVFGPTLGGAWPWGFLTRPRITYSTFGASPSVGWGLKPGWWSPKLKQGLGVWKTRSFEVGRRARSLGLHALREGEPGRRSAELGEAGLAVGHARATEGALGERAQAEGAGEVVRVEAAAQGRHASASHREATYWRTGPARGNGSLQRAALVLRKSCLPKGAKHS